MIRMAAEGFVRAWNQANFAGIDRLLTPDARVDMSRKDQGNLPPTKGGYQTLSDMGSIEKFMLAQWNLGERFSFSSIKPFDHQGAYIEGLRARFTDGTHQAFVHAKLAYSCKDSSFGHIVLITRHPST